MQVRAYGTDSSMNPSTPPVSSDLLPAALPERLGGIHPGHHEMLYIAEGKVKLSTNSRHYFIAGPALILIPLDTSHRLDMVSKPYRFAYWELQDDQAASFPSPHECTLWNEMQDKRDRNAADMKMIFERVDALNEVMNADWVRKHPELLQQISISDIQAIMALIRHAVKSQIPDLPNRPFLKRHSSAAETVEMLVRTMESTYWNDFTLQKLTELSRFNPSYLIRLFKTYKGMTPFQYLNNIRMNAAEKFLQNSDMSIQEIAIITGYQSIHYFSRSFKQKYGVSPNHWRNEHNKDKQLRRH